MLGCDRRSVRQQASGAIFGGGESEFGSCTTMDSALRDLVGIAKCWKSRFIARVILVEAFGQPFAKITL
jgi:hypothetical protein